MESGGCLSHVSCVPRCHCPRYSHSHHHFITRRHDAARPIFYHHRCLHRGKRRYDHSRQHRLTGRHRARRRHYPGHQDIYLHSIIGRHLYVLRSCTDLVLHELDHIRYRHRDRPSSVHTQWHDHPERTIRHVLLISNSTFRTTLLRDRADAHVHRRHALRVVLISIFFLHLCTNLLLLGQQCDVYRQQLCHISRHIMCLSQLLFPGDADMCLAGTGLQCGNRYHRTSPGASADRA